MEATATMEATTTMEAAAEATCMKTATVEPTTKTAGPEVTAVEAATPVDSAAERVAGLATHSSRAGEPVGAVEATHAMVGVELLSSLKRPAGAGISPVYQTVAPSRRSVLAVEPGTWSSTAGKTVSVMRD